MHLCREKPSKMMKDLLQKPKARAIGGLHVFVKIVGFRLINALILNSTSYRIQARLVASQTLKFAQICHCTCICLVKPFNFNECIL